MKLTKARRAALEKWREKSFAATYGDVRADVMRALWEEGLISPIYGEKYPNAYTIMSISNKGEAALLGL